MRGSSNGMSVRADRVPGPFATGTEASPSPAKADHQTGASFQTIIGKARASSRDAAEPAADQRAARIKTRAGSLPGASRCSDEGKPAVEERRATAGESKPVDGSLGPKRPDPADPDPNSTRENEKENIQDQPPLVAFFAPILLNYSEASANRTSQPSAPADSGAADDAAPAEVPGASLESAERSQLAPPDARFQNVFQNANPAVGKLSQADTPDDISRKAPPSPPDPLDPIGGSIQLTQRTRKDVNDFSWRPESQKAGPTATPTDAALVPSPADDTDAANPQPVDAAFNAIESVQAGRREVAQAEAYRILFGSPKARAEVASSQDARPGTDARILEEPSSEHSAPIPSVPCVQPDRSHEGSNLRNEIALAPRQASSRNVRENSDANAAAGEQGDETTVQLPGGRKDSALSEPLSGPKAQSRDSHPPQIESAAPEIRMAADMKDVPVSKSQQAAASRPPDMIFQLAEKIHAQVQNGGTELTIQLKPESLGRMEIRAEAGVHGLVARIITESEGVKHYLESNLSTLQQNLHEQGLKIDRIELVFQDGIDGRLFGGQQNAGQAQGGQQGGDSRHPDPSGAAARFAADDEILFEPAAIAALGPNSTFHTVA